MKMKRRKGREKRRERGRDTMRKRSQEMKERHRKGKHWQMSVKVEAGGNG